MNNWTKNLPTRSGYYWFYGDAFSTKLSRPQDIRLYLVKVHNNIYICEGNFMINKNGYWQEAILPEIPS